MLAAMTTRVVTLLARTPARALALRAALAAMTSWLVIVPMGGVADDYPYYAPLGAVVAVTSSVEVSLRTSVQTVVALVLGAGLATTVLLLDLPRPLAIGLVVAVGTLLGALRRMGEMGSWVPISALFILVLGEGNPAHFVLGYLGITTLGVGVGAATSLALPPLHLIRTRHAQDDLRAALAERLDALADVIGSEQLPSEGDWEVRRPDLRAHSAEVEQLLALATGGPPVNWRVRKGRDEGQRLRERGRALAALALQVDELTDVLAYRERDDRQDLALPAWLRPAAESALRATADALRSDEDRSACIDAAWTAVRRLASEIRRDRHESGDDLFGAGALVVSIERTLTTMSPAASPSVSPASPA
ncbi:hypothetical protein GCM10009843_15520 [Nocardioides bigeumensis]|uniref:FUSC family protein n=2 Tax=Nocardioides bigeumensis TaxID=433657 RepID=A0ABP5JSM5_9ACTN